MISREFIGHEFPPFKTVIERGRVRLFCKAIDEDAKVHLDVDAARQLGFRDVLTPLTFPTAIAFDNPNPHCIYDLLGLNISWILHGEERHEYFDPIFAGDEITTQIRIADIFDRKAGTLEFIIARFTMRNQLEKLVCEIVRTLVVRRPTEGSRERQ